MINKQKLNLLVSMGEIVSSLAVVISLFYVAYEFSRSNTLTNRDIENIIYDRILKMDQLIVGNSDLAEIILKASNPADTLSSGEELRYLSFEHIFYDSWETAFYYHQEGILDPESWRTWNDWFLSETRNKPANSWKGNRKNYNGDFLEYMDRLIQN